MDLGTLITCSRSVAVRSTVARNTLTAQQKCTVVAGYGLIGVAGGPRARGDLGYPSALRTSSGGSPAASQHKAEFSDIPEYAGAARKAAHSGAVSKDFRELGASAG
jgi:hypothetical protein